MKRCIIISIWLLIFSNGYTQFAGQPFQFIQNKGQWDASIKFKGELATGAFFLHTNGFTVLMHDTADIGRIQRSHHQHATSNDPAPASGSGNPQLLSPSPNGVANEVNSVSKEGLHSHAYRLVFEGANPSPQIIPEKQTEEYYNYLIGNDPTKWATHVKIFGAVTLRDLYPNIDIRYYQENGNIKYDLLVHPGGDISRIAMRYIGAEQLSIVQKELHVKTSVGTVKELYPYSYQSNPETGKKTIKCQYEIREGNLVKFQINSYDKKQLLVIDPKLIFSTYAGGPNNWGVTATPGPDESFFSGATIFSSGYPVTTGAIFSGGSGNYPSDICITRFNSNGTKRMYATYLGGSGNDFAHSLIADPLGNLIVMGRTYSNDYPNSKSYAIDKEKESSLAVTKLNDQGFLYSATSSLRIGGSKEDGVNLSMKQFYDDESRSEVGLDKSNNIYIVSNTNSPDFPLIGGISSSNSFGGRQDAVVLKINPNCSDIIWSRFLGGSGEDGGFVMEFDPITNRIFVGGGTSSSNFPSVSGGIQSSLQGGIDAYVSIIDLNGNLIKSTYFGTSNIDILYGLKFDQKGYPYVMGVTRGTWPLLPSGMKSIPDKMPNSGQFVGKLDPSISSFIYTTVFGNGKNSSKFSPVAFAVDYCENLYITGWGDVTGFPIKRKSPSDYLDDVTDGQDFYFIQIARDGKDIDYGTYFGQEGGYSEHVDGGTCRYDPKGNIYQAICATCSGYGEPAISKGFPIYPKYGNNQVVATASGANGRGCNLAAVKIAFNFAGVRVDIRSYLNNKLKTTGCINSTFEFRDVIGTLVPGKTWIWEVYNSPLTATSTPIGGPTTTTVPVFPYTFINAGNYTVKVTALDPSSCNIKDENTIDITITGNEALLDFDVVKVGPCNSKTFTFTNKTVATPALSASSLTWDFGDGNTQAINPAISTYTHTYTDAAPKTFKTTLLLNDTRYCNNPGELEKSVKISGAIKAKIKEVKDGCAPYTVLFENASEGGTDYTWKIDGNIVSNAIDLPYTFPSAGNHTVELIASENTLTCSQTNSTGAIPFKVSANPVVSFNFVTPVVNTPIQFNNTSDPGLKYVWDLGDGTTKESFTLASITHQYNLSNLYTVTLTGTNPTTGCSASDTKAVDALIYPLFDLPNAFTPDRPGPNSVFKITGYGIVKMKMIIYNRWGQKVFETNSPGMGWDGKYNGKPQPMDVYTYTLYVEMSNYDTFKRSGEITLIR